MRKIFIVMASQLLFSISLECKGISKRPLLLSHSESIPINKTIQKDNESGDIYPSLRMFAEVINLIESKAFRKVDFRKFIEESLTAAVPYCDAHSAFLTKDSFKQTKETTSGKFSGIGITVMSKSVNDDELPITDVREDGPAYKAGLEPGDKIVEIDKAKLRGLSSDEVISRLRGKTNTKVSLKIIRDKKLLEFQVNREMIKNPITASYHFKNQNVYYLWLRLFTEDAAKKISDLLVRANKQEYNGILLDLRKNPGGILDTAVEMAGLFLKKGSLVVSTKDRNGLTISNYKTKNDPILDSEIPIFILIDNFTASASEILAGALKYYSEHETMINKKRLMVFLVGTSTFGKGSVQEVIPISNGGALKLTTMLYYLPGDISIQASGIDPDFMIKPRIIPEREIKWIKEFSGTETSLKHHITRDEARINNGKPVEVKKKTEAKKEETWEEKNLKRIACDTQIKSAVNMIKLLAMAKKYTPEEVDSREKAIKFLKRNFASDDLASVVKVQ